mmetsp:Transcript_18003/g.36299  ORF Transcript_18003/g.36299 Transcript_18003/m.36299 type:complete len:365 (-) Transcript_18003:745-1839(-)
MRPFQCDALLPAHLAHQVDKRIHHGFGEAPFCHQNSPRNETLNRFMKRSTVVPFPWLSKLGVTRMVVLNLGLDARRIQNPRIFNCDHLGVDFQLERFDNRVVTELCFVLKHTVDQVFARLWLLARIPNHPLRLIRIRLVLSLPRGDHRVVQIVKARLLRSSGPDDWHVRPELDPIGFLEVFCHPRRWANLVQDVVDLHLAVFWIQRLEPLLYLLRRARLVWVLVVQLRERLHDGFEADVFRPLTPVVVLGHIAQFLLQDLAVPFEKCHVARRLRLPNPFPLLMERDALHRLRQPRLSLPPFLRRVREIHFELQPSEKLAHPLQQVAVSRGQGLAVPKASEQNTQRFLFVEGACARVEVEHEPKV